MQKNAGLKSVIVTSSYRTKEHQIEVMYSNVSRYGAADQKKVYGKNGDEVIDTYLEAIKKKGATPESVKAAMLKKAGENGFISPHSSDNYANLNVIDLSYKGLTDEEYNRFRKAAEDDPSISRVFGKEENDKALHIEIIQQQQPESDASGGEDPAKTAVRNIFNARSVEEAQHWLNIYNEIMDQQKLKSYLVK